MKTSKKKLPNKNYDEEAAEKSRVNLINASAMSLTAYKKSAPTPSSSSTNNLLHLSLNEPLLANEATSSFFISPSSMSPSSSTSSFKLSSNSKVESKNQDESDKTQRRSKLLANNLISKKIQKVSTDNEIISSDEQLKETFDSTKKLNNKNQPKKNLNFETLSKKVALKNKNPKEAIDKTENESNSENSTDVKPKVLVPSWRIVPFKRSFNMEGTEILTDEIFLKRHQKYENEEKQIKRWDMQRQRAEQERLKILKANGQLNGVTTNTTHSANKSGEELQTGTSNTVTLDTNKYSKKRKTISKDNVIYYKPIDQVNLDDIQFIQVIDEEELKNIEIPEEQSKLDKTEANITMKQEDSNNLLAIASLTPTKTTKSKQNTINSSTNLFDTDANKSQELTKSKFLSIVNNLIDSKKSKKANFNKSIDSTYNKENENNKKFRSKSMCNISDLCQNERSCLAINQNRSFKELPEKIDSTFNKIRFQINNTVSNTKNKIPITTSSDQTTSNLKFNCSNQQKRKSTKTQQSPDKKRKRLNPE